MFVKMALGLLAIGLCLFLAASLTTLFLPSLGFLLTKIGAYIWLIAFGYLIFLGLVTFLKSGLQSLWDYFAESQRVKRYLLFKIIRENQLKNVFLFQKRQLAYFNELQRQRLETKDNRRQIEELSFAISLDLKKKKKVLPRKLFKQYQRENVYYRVRQNANELLKLQEKITLFKN